MDLKGLIELLRSYLSGLWRYRWRALMLSALICAIAWPFIYSLPDRYEASTRIYVDTESVLKPLLAGLVVENNLMTDVSLITRTLLSRPQLERVIRDVDLDLTAKTTAQFEGLLASVESRIELGSQGANIYTISYNDRNRDTALQVVRKLLDNFVGDTLGSTMADSKQAETTLEAQIADYERRLDQAEARLTTFKQENVGLMPGATGDYYEQLQAANERVTELSQKMRIARRRLQALEAQLDGEEPIFGIMQSSGVGGPGTSVDAQIQSLEQRLTNLLVEFTERHPEVVRVQSLLDELNVKRAEELANRPMTADINPATGSLDLNPVYQQIKIQHSTAEVELASLSTELADGREEVNRLKTLVDVVPEVEARLNSLNRDYGVVKTRYEQMLARWENLQTAKRVRSGTDELQFRIIDPPFAAAKPVGPPRSLYVMGAFVLAIGAGIGLAVVMTMLNPVFSTQNELRTSGLPILGEIAFVASEGRPLFNTNRLMFFAGLVVLSCAAVAATALSDLGAQIMHQVLG